MTSTVKAAKATILLGNIELDCLQFPDGSYHFFINQLNEELGIKASDSTGKKYLQPLLEANPNRVNKASVEGIKSHLKTLSIDLVSEAIGIYATLGNQKCIAVAIACISEALERRADKAFNVIRTEQEINERFKTRQLSILSRTFWTDCIDAYVKRRGLDDGYSKFIYANVSNYLNKALFGKTSKEIRDYYGVGNNSPRDYFPSETLRCVEAIERATALRVLNTNSEPLQALKDVVAYLGYTEPTMPL